MIRKPQESTVAIDELTPYEHNARTHSEAQLKQLANSIKEFGFTNPILIDENNKIIAGHGRVEAAKLIQLTHIPCLRITWLTEVAKRAYVLADNKLALNADWDENLLERELDALLQEGFNLPLTGFSLQELSEILYIDDDAPESTASEPAQFKKMDFFLHQDQANLVEDALLRARAEPAIDTGINENNTANALHYICEFFLKNHHY